MGFEGSENSRREPENSSGTVIAVTCTRDRLIKPLYIGAEPETAAGLHHRYPAGAAPDQFPTHLPKVRP
jgi:hypothetical protein